MDLEMNVSEEMTKFLRLDFYFRYFVLQAFFKLQLKKQMNTMIAKMQVIQSRSFEMSDFFFFFFSFF